MMRWNMETNRMLFLKLSPKLRFCHFVLGGTIVPNKKTLTHVKRLHFSDIDMFHSKQEITSENGHCTIGTEKYA